MYVIKEIWINSMENGRSNAMGYRVVGYVNTEEEARKIKSDGGMLSAKRFPWPLIWGDEPRFKYEKVEKFTEASKCVSYWKDDDTCLAKRNGRGCVYTKVAPYLCPVDVWGTDVDLSRYGTSRAE